MIQCRLCGVLGHKAKGVVLQRVNEKGVEGVWECRPICGAQMKADDCLVAAIEGAFECQHPRVVLGSPRRCADCGISLSPCLHSQVVYEPHRQCAQCGISMPSPAEIAKTANFPSYSAKQLRDDLLYEYLGQSPEPGLFEFLDWLVKRDKDGVNVPNER